MDDKACIFSGATENLNTSMKIRLDDGNIVEVWVSDEYADDATPRSVKVAYLAKYPVESDESDEMKQLKTMAAKLGVAIVKLDEMPTKTAPAIIAPPPSQQSGEQRVIRPQKPAPAQPAPLKLLNENNRLVPSKSVDSRGLDLKVDMSSPSAQEAGLPQNQYSITSVSKPSVDLKEGEVSELGRVAGRGGVDIIIPVRRVGKCGTTRVNVSNTETDQKLQSRFKGMAEGSKSGDGVCYGKNGYDMKFVKCPLCNTRPQINPDCKKCKGTGEIMTTRF